MAMRRWHIVFWLFLALLVIPGAARAQTGSPRSPTRTLSGEQLDAFVELTGDPKPMVWQRLLADPLLVAYAAAAADARLARRSSGKAMTIAGFTILGVGAGAGYGLFLWGVMSGVDCSSYYSDSCEPDKSMMTFGAVLMLVSIGTGLGIGIPGIVRMVRASEAENEASARYQNPGMPYLPPYPGAYSGGPRQPSPAPTLGAPILSFRF